MDKNRTSRQAQIYGCFTAINLVFPVKPVKRFSWWCSAIDLKGGRLHTSVWDEDYSKFPARTNTEGDKWIEASVVIQDCKLTLGTRPQHDRKHWLNNHCHWHVHWVIQRHKVKTRLIFNAKTWNPIQFSNANSYFVSYLVCSFVPFPITV